MKRIEGSFYEWKTSAFGPYDVLAVLSDEEKAKLKDLYSEDVNRAAHSTYGYCFWLDTTGKTIVPVARLSYVFGGQYNAESPVGRKLIEFVFDADVYTFQSLSERERKRREQYPDDDEEE